jgi:hypothetical protein
VSSAVATIYRPCLVGLQKELQLWLHVEPCQTGCGSAAPSMELVMKPQPASTREVEPRKHGSIRLRLPLYPFVPSAGAGRSALDQAEAPTGRGGGRMESRRGGEGWGGAGRDGGVAAQQGGGVAERGGVEAPAGGSSAADGVRARDTRAVVRDLRQMQC